MSFRVFSRMLAVVFALILLGGLLAYAARGSSMFLSLMGYLMLACGVMAAIWIFAAGNETKAMKVLRSIMMLIPLVNLLQLIWLYRRARQMLRAEGMEPGWFGAPRGSRQSSGQPTLAELMQKQSLQPGRRNER